MLGRVNVQEAVRASSQDGLAAVGFDRGIRDFVRYCVHDAQLMNRIDPTVNGKRIISYSFFPATRKPTSPACW